MDPQPSEAPFRAQVSLEIIDRTEVTKVNIAPVVSLFHFTLIALIDKFSELFRDKTFVFRVL